MNMLYSVMSGCFSGAKLKSGPEPGNFNGLVYLKSIFILVGN